jgi:dTDP-4-amino-4,6-dideoxygalactose transaminase
VSHEVPIPFLRPEVPPIDAVLTYFRRSEDAGYYSNGGPCVRLLTERLDRYLGGAVRCVPVANCTLGLMVAMRAAFGVGDRTRLVVTPSFTFPATACAVEWAGFRPLFADVDAESWHLAPEAVERALSRYGDRIAGVLACSTFGTAPSRATRRAWREVCRKQGVPLVVDSAAGFGAVDDAGDRLGTSGDTEVFSFHATKPFAIGEGGVVATGDEELAQRVQRLVNFGIGDEPSVSESVGLNAKLSEVHAATALAALDLYDGVLECRRRAAESAIDALEVLGVSRQAGSEGSTWQFVPARMPTSAARDGALAAAPELGVQARAYFSPALHHQPAFADRPVEGPLEATDRVAARALSLPLVRGKDERRRLVEVVSRGLERVGAC